MPKAFWWQEKAEDKHRGILISITSEPCFWRVWPFSLVCRPVGVRWYQPVTQCEEQWCFLSTTGFGQQLKVRVMGSLPEYDLGQAVGTGGVSLGQYSSCSSRHSLNQGSGIISFVHSELQPNTTVRVLYKHQELISHSSRGWEG